MDFLLLTLNECVDVELRLTKNGKLQKEGKNIIVNHDDKIKKLPNLKNLNYEIEKIRNLDKARIIRIKCIRKGHRKLEWLFNVKTITKDLM